MRWWQQLMQEMTAEEALIFKDDLTNIYNRRFYKMRLKQAIYKHSEKENPLSFLMLDLDHFKTINDTYGHQTGDVALSHVSNVMRQIIAERGFVIRYAGDEFLIVLPDQGRESAKRIAEEISYRVASEKLETRSKQEIQLSLSIGCASYPEDDPAPEALFELADSALYVSKENGRNQVSLVGDKVKSKEALVGVFPCPECIGRETLLNIFQNKLLSFEKNQILFVEGPNGVGKSRLLQEFYVRSKATPDFRSLESKCDSQDNQTAYGSLMNILDQLLWIEMEEKDTLLAHLTEAEKYVLGHYFPHLKSVKTFSEKDVDAFIERKNQYFLEGIEKVLKNVAQDKKLLLFFDDLQWMDEYSLGLFTQILWRDQIPLFFVGMYQEPSPEESSPLYALLADERISMLPIERQKLFPLSLEETRQMIQGILPKFQPDADFLKLCFEYTQGFPHKIEDVMKRLLETQKIFWVENECRTQTITPLDFLPVSGQNEKKEKFQPFLPETIIQDSPSNQDLDFNFSAEDLDETKRIAYSPGAFPFQKGIKVFEAPKTISDEEVFSVEKIVLNLAWIQQQLQELEQNQTAEKTWIKAKVHPLLEQMLLFPTSALLQKLLTFLTKNLTVEESKKRKEALILLKEILEVQPITLRRKLHLLLYPQLLLFFREENQQNVFSLALRFVPELVLDLLFQQQYSFAIGLLKLLGERAEESPLTNLVLITFEKITASYVLDLLMNDIQSENIEIKNEAILLLGLLGDSPICSLINIVLHSENARNRLAGLEAIQRIRPQASQILTQMFNEKTQTETYCRLLSLNELFLEGSSRERLKNALLHPAMQVRNEALLLVFRKEMEEWTSILSEVFLQIKPQWGQSLLQSIEEMEPKEHIEKFLTQFFQQYPNSTLVRTSARFQLSATKDASNSHES